VLVTMVVQANSDIAHCLMRVRRFRGDLIGSGKFSVLNSIQSNSVDSSG
jgi:hypothetical protein